MFLLLTFACVEEPPPTIYGPDYAVRPPIPTVPGEDRFIYDSAEPEMYLGNIPVLDPWTLDVVVEVAESDPLVTIAFASCSMSEPDFGDCEVVYNPGRNSVVFVDGDVSDGDEVVVTYVPRELP